MQILQTNPKTPRHFQEFAGAYFQTQLNKEIKSFRILQHLLFSQSAQPVLPNKYDDPEEVRQVIGHDTNE